LYYDDYYYYFVTCGAFCGLNPPSSYPGQQSRDRATVAAAGFFFFFFFFLSKLFI
jgi:hypothetical protein